MTAAESADRVQTYDPRAIQEKWQARWDAMDLFRASDDPADPRPRRYVLDMFPYPSGDLHMGHAEAYAVADAMARYYFQRGHNVLHPIGWDAFGLPAENAAIRGNSHPADWTYENIETQAASFRRYALSFDWSRRLQTCDPEYYRWTQWLFLRLLRARPGLPRRTATSTGARSTRPCWPTSRSSTASASAAAPRSSAGSLTQWYFKITEYADRLLADMDPLEGKWPERGAADAAQLDRPQRGRRGQLRDRGPRPSRSPCSRPGRTRCTARRSSWSPPTPPLAAELCAPEHRAELDAYLADVRKLTDIERQSTDREKTGVFLGRYAVNPVNGEQIPVWAADYVLPDYGTGAIMAVPAHDQRDLDFARKFGLPVRVVVDTGGPDPAETGLATPGEGTLVNSGPLDGLSKADAIQTITGILAERGPGPRPRSTTGCATGWSPGSGSGARRSRSCTARAAARFPCPTTSCRCGCPTCAGRTWPPRASRRWPRPATG